jgi:RHH-type transcriptional regulator, rel operon repressor / antitoxin RelB
VQDLLDPEKVIDILVGTDHGRPTGNPFSSRTIRTFNYFARLKVILHKLASALYCVQTSTRIEVMRSTTFTVRVDSAAKKRLEKLAKSTGRSRSFLAAEAINEYLDVNEWQVAGIKRAIESLDRGEGVPHDRVRDWVTSWGSGRERPVPKRS